MIPMRMMGTTAGGHQQQAQVQLQLPPLLQVLLPQLQVQLPL